MVTTLKDMLRLVTPPVFIRLANRLRSNGQTDVYGLSGDYRSWDEALSASTGYDNQSILERTRIALLKVKNGEAVYERDSVLFDEIAYAWPVLAGLMWVAARCGGSLDVLDVGGSLGSTYFQNRAFLSLLPAVRWNIVEQAHHVETGKAWFEDDRLHFYSEIADCLADTHPNVVLLSGVLQYLEHPYMVVDQLRTCSSDYIVIDRTPFWAGPTDRLCVESVPPSIYAASYPSWIFSRRRFYAGLNETWEIIAEFDSLDHLRAPVRAVWKGLILERKMHVKSPI